MTALDFETSNEAQWSELERAVSREDKTLDPERFLFLYRAACEHLAMAEAQGEAQTPAVPITVQTNKTTIATGGGEQRDGADQPRGNGSARGAVSAALDRHRDARRRHAAELPRRSGEPPGVHRRGAHFDPRIALRRALTELGQLLPALTGRLGFPPGRVVHFVRLRHRVSP